MSDLEKYILENRHALDTDHPQKGHARRFSKKLTGKEKSPVKMHFRHYLQIAASIAVIVASGIVIVKSSKGSSKMAVTPEVQEFMDAKAYYASQVNAKYDELSSFEFASQNEKELLLDELKTMDTHYQELLNKFKANPGDERVISALIQHYQMKLDVMDQILNQLMSFKNLNKSEEDENTDV